MAFSLKASRSALLVVWLAAFPAAALSQGPRPRPAAAKPARSSVPPKGSIPAEVLELNNRLIAAVDARASNDPFQVIAANRRLLGMALRQMAILRNVESAYPQAAELFKQSLDFEDDPAAHVQLAILYLRFKQPNDALAESEKATLADPKDAIAWNAKGKAWMMLKDYKQGAENLARSLSLKGDMETAYSLATCFLALKEKEKAQLVFRDIIEASGNRASLHVMFGRAYRDAAMLDDAAVEFRRALAIDPKTPHAHYFIGLIGLIKNEWSPLPEIEQEMQAELRNYPDDYLANYVMGVFTSNRKELEASDRYLTIAVKQQPESPEPYLYLGLNAYSRGDKKASEEFMRKEIALTGEDEARGHYQIRRAYTTLGRILVQTGRKEEAAKWLEKARAMETLGMQESQQSIAEVFNKEGVGMGAVMPYISPENEPSLGPQGFVDVTGRLNASEMANAGLNQKGVEVAQQQENKLREILGTGYNDLGTAEARQRHYAEALEHFKQAERWSPEIPGLIRNLGIAAARTGDHATVIRTLGKQLAADPGDSVARAMLGLSYFMSGRFADAANTISPLGEQAMADPGLAYPFAASLVKTGQLKQAAAVMERLEQAAPTADTLLLTGPLWSDVGDDDRAVRALQRASALDPSLRKAHYQAGLILVRAGKPAQAVPEFEAEIALSPDDADAKYNLGFAYLQQSQAEQAQQVFESVVAEHPEHADAQYQLGKLLLDHSQVKEAIAHLEAAARLGPEKDFVHYQLQAAYRKADRPADADRELEIYKEVKARNRQQTLPEAKPNQ